MNTMPLELIEYLNKMGLTSTVVNGWHRVPDYDCYEVKLRYGGFLRISGPELDKLVEEKKEMGREYREIRITCSLSNHNSHRDKIDEILFEELERRIRSEVEDKEFESISPMM